MTSVHFGHSWRDQSPGKNACNTILIVTRSFLAVIPHRHEGLWYYQTNEEQNTTNTLWGSTTQIVTGSFPKKSRKSKTATVPFYGGYKYIVITAIYNGLAFIMQGLHEGECCEHEHRAQRMLHLACFPWCKSRILSTLKSNKRTDPSSPHAGWWL